MMKELIQTNHDVLPRRSRLEKGVALTVLSAFLSGAGAPVFAQTDYQERIKALEEELAILKQQIAEVKEVVPVP